MAVSSWPQGRLPIEIFTLIVNYLPRSSVQNMRLVNKEFEAKVSHYLFRVVVVPFRPEIYDVVPSPVAYASQGGLALQGSVKLQGKGMKVFEGFGDRISKFAMSFEFDEIKLATPPPKSDQECITTFWGMYRWPFKNYNRFTQLEGLEQAADETGTMTEALRFMGRAKELGLSIDGGLGWIAGPDTNHLVLQRAENLSVFGESIFAPEPPPTSLPSAAAMSRWGDVRYGHTEANLSSLKRVFQEAGYRGEALDKSLGLLLEPDQLMHNLARGEIPEDLSFLKWNALRHAAVIQRHLATDFVPASDVTDAANTHSDNVDADGTPLSTPPDGSSTRVCAKRARCPLKPNDLTSSQRELLLEIEWAQRAFMQSYAIAVIDNRGAFDNIQALTVARLPSRHLPILRRPDFWNSLPQLNSLSLAIIPDWREVAKLPTSWVDDVKVRPSLAVSSVYQILDEHILTRENIKTIHLEWLCGGEEVPGLFTRNQHILPAPLVPKALDMVYRDTPSLLLSFPYVEHLSLKNCWITPHILTKLGLSLRSSAIKSLTLNSVSLTAPIPVNSHPEVSDGGFLRPAPARTLLAQAIRHNHLMNIQAGIPLQHNQAPHLASDPDENQVPDWLVNPRVGSWASIISTLTPGNSLAEMVYARGVGQKPLARSPSNLTRLKFESCGYVRILLDFDQSMLDWAVHDPDLSTQCTQRVQNIEPFMMDSGDDALGIIVNHIDKREAETLEEAFHMTLGWDESRSTLLAECRQDGIQHPGNGRFTGIIDGGRSSASNRS